ncbi:MAG: hypothetical protein VYA56_07475, partial [Actinomycetota bacterium]|nr:hypothetical protein [Actinomycetota bacterium]
MLDILSRYQQFRYAVRPPAIPTVATNFVVQSLGEGITHRDETCTGLSLSVHSNIMADGSFCQQSTSCSPATYI